MKKLITLGLTVTSVALLGACGNTGSTEKDSATSSSTTTVESTVKEEAKVLGIGDTAEIEGVEYTVTGVELTDERNEFADTDPAHVVKISYTVKNNSDQEIPVGMDMTVYDPNDTQTESYPNDNSMGSVAAGKQFQAVDHYGLDDLGEIEIHLQPAFSFEDAAVFKVNVQ